MSSQTQAARATVLVVDDEPQVLVALEDLLSDDFVVIKSESAERALHLVEQQPDIAVVVSDQRMPRMHGDELFKRLRARYSAERILATGYADLNAVIRAVNDGQIFAYVTKPWDPDDLRAKIQRAADHFRLARELEQERLLLEDLMNSVPDAIYFKDTALRFQRVNAEFSAVFGARMPLPIVGRTLSEVWPGVPGVDAAEEEERELLRANEPARDVVTSFMVDGEKHWFSTTKAPIRNRSGHAMGLVAIARDITSRKLQEARIFRLTRTYAVLSGINATILRVHERAALLAEACNIALSVGELALAVVAGVEVGAEVGAEHRLLAGGGNSPALVTSVADWLVRERTRKGSLVERALAIAHPLVVDDLRQDESAGELRAQLLAAGHVALAVVPVFVSGRLDCVLALCSEQAAFFDDDQIKLLAEIADNIGFALEHSAQAERLDFLAYYDDLTRLANRRLLSDRLAQQLVVCAEQDLKLAVVLVDVERFRHVNETLGKRAGDSVLQELALRIGGVAEGRATIARLASNTFAAVLVPLENEADVAQWAEQALVAFGRPLTISDTELRLSARVGISLFPSDGLDADSLLANAEAALKSAKDSARRYVFYTSALNGRVAERLSLETRLRKAIEQNEFLLHYQPKVDLKTGRVVGLEALIRWASEGKLVPPVQFIPLLEETGMIVEVGTWVMGHAAAQFAAWTARGLSPPRIAVNVSPLQLGHPDFVGCIEAALRKYPLASTGLDLEITESVLMEDLTGNTQKLRLAKEAGLGVAIDDFGTGYSSLGYISRLPIDALKIDRSFVLRMSDDPQEMAIVTTIISLAHALDLKVIAEGVETTLQAQLLRLLKCDQIQGYLVAKPLAAEDVEALLSTSFDFGGRSA
ncbi:MAG: EAL domain-containing protein [Polyangiaceae bacterium]